MEASQIYSGAGDPEIAARERPVMSMSGNHGHGLFKVFTVKNTIGRCHQGHQPYWQRQFNWVSTSCPAAAATRTPGPPPGHKGFLPQLKPGDSFAPEGSIPCALQWPGADSNGIGCAGAAIAQPLFVSFNSWVLRMAQWVCVLSLPTQLSYYCSDLLKAVPLEPCQRHGLHLTRSRV